MNFFKIFIQIVFAWLVLGCSQYGKPKQIITERIIPVANDAWSGSSINVLAGVKQTLYTDGVYQYGGYYDKNAHLVLVKRRLGENTWQKRVTEFTGNVNDAHNHISLVVDGSGYLHVAWDHHNNPLNYAKSQVPGGLNVVKTPMLEVNERRVTYPQFFRLASGDLLFQYRDGGSGQGSLVMNAYSAKTGQWHRLHSNLIDGENKRSAYWSMSLDENGVLHLAWVWRETPDVASNHDIMYAQSRDNGISWQTLEKQPITLPMTQASTLPVAVIPESHKLMNPPDVAADRESNPFITSYWADSPTSKPRHRVLYNKGEQWQEIKAPAPKYNFDLEGRGTKRTPYSRAVLLVESNWETSWFHLLYRDDFANAVVVATVANLDKPKWKTRVLVNESTGAWEPSIDPSQWQRLKQAHVLLQAVQQQDGNDNAAFKTKPSELQLVMWSPNWERHQNLKVVPAGKVKFDLDAHPVQAEIADVAVKAAQWQWQNVPEGWNYDRNSWALAPFYIGVLMADTIAPEANLPERVVAQSNQLNWALLDRIYDADDYCVVQPYLRLYQKFGDEKMRLPSQKRLDYILDNPATGALDWGTSFSRQRWSWSDALYMGPMSWLLMYEVTGDQRYLDFMNREWWATSERLYRPALGLFFRDESYLDVREHNGKTIHWSRGNGWAFAGLAQVIAHFPKTHPDFPRYVQQFKEMAVAFSAAQQFDGLWRPGLLDPATHTAKETSGSAFAVYALAWGVNYGVLEKKTYQPAIIRGWNALANSVTPEGKLENVQPIGAAPHGFDPNNSEPFATGAFLMAASEVYTFIAGE